MAKIRWSELNDAEKWDDDKMPLAAAVCASHELAAEFEKRWNAYETLEKVATAAAKASDEWESCHHFAHEDAMRELAEILERLKIPAPAP